MKKFVFLFVIFMTLTYSLQAERKKVGLVLSGGGAKGVAHIGVLKVLERAGIPVDYIAGTSMGSIVGGLYSIGYDAEMLDSLVKKQNWSFLLSDRVYRYNLPFSQKETDEKYLVSIPMIGGRRIQVPSGFISGQNIYNLFSELTIGYHDSLSFLTLPIPFSCVAANVVNGKEVVLNKGNLPLAMRSSMAIPGVFAPVRLDSMLLVDGGIANNFPTDVGLAMGADIIIGVDVSSELRKRDQLNSVLDILDQLTSFMGMDKYEDNIKLCDLYIKPDIVPYSAASFDPEAIDTLIRRGEEAAWAHWDEFMKLKEQLGLAKTEKAEKKIENKFIITDSLRIGQILIEGVPAKEEKWIRKKVHLTENTDISIGDLHRAIAILYGTGSFFYVNYQLNGKEVYDLTLTLKEKPTSSINFGFRFDSQEMAAILLNTTISPKNLRGFQLSLTGRLSMNPYVKAEYLFGENFLRRAGLSYMYKYNDIDLYRKGHKLDNITFSQHVGELSFSDINLLNCKFMLGIRYEYFDYESFLYSDHSMTTQAKPEGFLGYHALARYETFDKKYYPTRGVSFLGEYSLYTDNGIHYDGGAPFSALAGNFETAWSLSRRFTVLPAFYGRILIGRDIPFSYRNYMGGEVAGRYMSQQLPFVGIHHFETFDNTVLALRMKLRYRIGSKHYVTATANYAKQEKNFFDILGGDDIWGGGISYSYDTLIGPIELLFDMSNWDKNLGIYFSLGYYF